jgi:LysM repeat protein
MPAMSKAQIREREEKALKKWKKKGGKTTKLPTRTARGAATPPSSSSRSGKGPMGSGGRLDPQGSVRSYTHPKVTAPSGGKLPVPLKVVKKAVETGTLDDLYAALGKKAGQLRKWFKTYTGAAIKPSRKSSKEASERSGVKPITGRKPSRKPSKEASERSGVKPITGRKPSRKPSKEASERKNVKPIKRNKALVTSGKKDVPGPGPKVPPAIRSKPQPGTSKIPRSGIKPPSQSGKPKPLPLAIKPKAAIPPITSGDDKGKGRGTHTPYSVKKGDTLSQIAHSKGTTLKALLAANNIAAKDANKLRVGQKLVLPGTVKDRKSVYQGMTKSQMAAMHMPKNKKTAPKMTDPTWGKAKPKVDDFAKMPKPKKKHTSPSQEARERKNVKPIKKKPEKFLGMFEIDPPEGGRKVDLPFGLSYKTISDAQRKKEFPMGDDHHKRGGQIKGYKKGGKVKKVRKASRPRGVGIALRGWGKAMR